MKNYKLAFIGFGNVGKALAQLLLLKRAEIEKDYGITFSVTGISTRSHGSVIDTAGIDLELAVKAENFLNFSNNIGDVDQLEFIKKCHANVIFENTPVNYTDGQPAIDHITTALDCGMHVITANKGPVVHAYNELTEIATRKGRKFYFESTVMDGAPIFGLFRSALPAARIISFEGILNSTTNMILTRMELGESFEEAISYCQRIGIAETDPSGDIDGWDSAIKIAALVNVLMRSPIKPADIQRKGIRGLKVQDIEKAKAENKRWKLICSAFIDDGSVRAEVTPQLVGLDSPLYSVEGTSSILLLHTDVLGRLTLIEDNPGPHTTAYGLLADFINAVQ